MQSPTLRDMIQEAIDRGASLRDLQDSAVDPVTGERVGKDTISKIRRGDMNRMPMEHHLRGIAAALKQPYERVRQAAIAEWLPGDDGTPGLTDEEREELRTEALRLQAVADEARARADEALARLDRQTGERGPAHPKSA